MRQLTTKTTLASRQVYSLQTTDRLQQARAVVLGRCRPYHDEDDSTTAADAEVVADDAATIEDFTAQQREY